MAGPTLAQLAQNLDSGKVTSRDLVEQSLAAIADPSGEGGRAFIKADAQGARAAADHADSLRKSGRAPSPLAGIPFSSKDIFDLAIHLTRNRVLEIETCVLYDARNGLFNHRQRI